ncbi:hypothetical protein AD998_08935 [bacterium 336/3]|nr:hypothetical protein AD998_08935 [bacterium 336/3]
MVNDIQIKSNKEEHSIFYLGQLVIFFVYVGILLFSVSKHELWGDEIHSWNIAKSSNSLIDLFQNIRYEGHPPLWYIFLFFISKISHNPESFQWVHAVISILVIFLILHASPFPFLFKVLIPLGYYFAFEYSVLSRNYAIGILIAFYICLILNKTYKYKLLVFYLLIFLLSNTHLLGLVLSVSFCVYVAYDGFEKNRSYYQAIGKLFVGAIIVLPSLYLIMPPSDSELNFSFWIDRWNLQQLLIILQIPVKSFFTIPAWWNHHFWNSNFLLEWNTNNWVIRIVSICSFIGIMGAIYYLLKKNKGILIFFGCNFLLTCLVGFIFPLTSTRYVGFVFIAFIISMWFYLGKDKFDIRQRAIILGFLVLQIFGASIALYRDWKQPFSNSLKVKDLYEIIPKNETIVTDYWCLNYLSAFVDKPFYCLGFKREMSFLLWDREMANILTQTNLYSSGVKELMEKKSVEQIYLISTNDMNKLQSIDIHLISTFEILNLAKWEGAIESNSNLYLYLIKVKK